MKLIFLGAPGAGKGTQAELVAQKLGIPTISTGNILRAAAKSGTPVGIRIKETIDAGKLVSDDLIIEIVSNRLNEGDCENGYILDGVPRTVAQAEALEKSGIEIDAALLIDVPDETIIERMTGRRTCSKCSATYHTVYNPPKEEEVCDLCGGELVIRADDAADTVKNRLYVYHEETEPLVHYYTERGKLRRVIGQEILSDTSALVMKALEIE